MKSKLKTVRITASEIRYYEVEVNVPITASNEYILQKMEPDDAQIADKCSVWNWDNLCEVEFNQNAYVLNIGNES